MENRPYFLLLYGCSIIGKQQSDWSKVMDAARRLNDDAPQADRIQLLSNFDSARGYIGLPLATSKVIVPLLSKKPVSGSMYP